MQTAQRIFASVLLVLSGSVFGAEISLSGTVSNPDGTGRSGVTISLAGSAHSTVTTSDGRWQLSGSTGVARHAPPRTLPTSGHLSSRDGRLRIAIAGRDLSGRALPNMSQPITGFDSNTGFRSWDVAVPDTIVYSWNGKAFLRDTITLLNATDILRTFDTSWNPSIVYGYFDDLRDGRIYRTVGIGTQIWMAENLNFKPSGSDSGWCYANSSDSCSKYGRLYTWSEAMQGAPSSTSSPSGVQGVCPDGWHVPSDAEWRSLEVAVGMDSAAAASTGWRGSTEGAKLKSSAGWNNSGGGTDERGFRVLPAGDFYDGQFYEVGDYTYFWTASQNEESFAWIRYFHGGDSTVGRYINEASEFSLRCRRN